jgi:hypothetical protein
MARQPRIYRYVCPACDRDQTVICRYCGTTYRLDTVKQPNEKWVKRHILFGERQWKRAVARAAVTPGVNGPSELIRLALDEILALPPIHLISS